MATSGTWTYLGLNGSWQLSSDWNATPFPGTPGLGIASTEAGTFGTSGSGIIDLNGAINFQSVYFGNGGDSAAFTIGDANDTWTVSGTGNTTTGGAFINAPVTVSQTIAAGSIVLTGSNNNFFNNSTNTGVVLNVTGPIGHNAAGNSNLIIGGTGGQGVNITGPVTSATGTTVQVIKDGGANNTATLGAVTTNNALLYVRGGTLSLTGITNVGTGPIIVQQNSTTRGNSVLNISSDLNALNLAVNQSGDRTGAVYQTAGSVNFSQTSGTGNLAIGAATAGQNNSGYYKISGGTLLTNEIGVASGANGSGGGVNGSVGILEATGGVVNVGGAGYITVARGGTTSSGLLNSLPGSTINAARIENLWGGTAGAQSVVNVAGVVNTTASTTLGLNLVNTATANTTSVANLLPGGVFTTGLVTAGNATPIAHFNFNGGTLKAAATNAGGTFLTSANLDAVNVYAGGGTIDNNATAITIGQPLAAPAGQGISGSTISVPAGGTGYFSPPLVKFTGGTGTGATGYATISGGVVTGIVVTSPGIGYTSGDTLTATFFGGLGLTSAGAAGTAATVVTGIPVVANATTGGIAYRGSGITTVSATNTYGGATSVTGGTLLINGAHTGSGLYTVGDSVNVAALGGSGSISSAVTVTNQGNLTAGDTSIATFNVGALTLDNGSSVLSQVGATNTVGSGVNDLVAIAGNLTLSGGTSTFRILGTPVAGLTYTLATYGGTLGGAGTIAVATALRANVSLVPTGTTPGSIQAVINSVGSANLVFKGNLNSGAWDLQTTQNFLNTGNANAPDVFFNGDNVTFNDTATTGTVNLIGSLSPNRIDVTSNTLNYYFGGAGSIIGSGSLNKSGNTTLTLATSNSFSGGTTINAGTIDVGGGTAVGTVGTGTVTINNGGTLSLHRLGGTTVANLAGTGSLIANSGTVSTPVILSSSNPGFSGGVRVVAGELRATQFDGLGTGTLSVAPNANLAYVNAGTPGGTIANTVILDGQGTNSANGNLTGILGAQTLTFTGGVTLSSESAVRVDTGTIALAGTVSGAGRLVKTGAANLVLNAANNYTGGTTIAAGNVYISAANNLGAVPASFTADHIRLGAATLFTTADITLEANRGITLTDTFGVLNVGTTTTLTSPGGISSTAGTILYKRGAGTLVLGGTNSFTGLLSVGFGTENNGVVAITSDTALAGVGSLQVGGDNAGIGMFDFVGGRTITQTIFTNGRNQANPFDVLLDLRGVIARANGGLNTIGDISIVAGGGGYRLASLAGSTLSVNNLNAGVTNLAGGRIFQFQGDGDFVVRGVIADLATGVTGTPTSVIGIFTADSLGFDPTTTPSFNGTLTLKNDNTATGTFTSGSGTLNVGGGGTLGTAGAGTLNIRGGTVTLDRTTAAVLPNVAIVGLNNATTTVSTGTLVKNNINTAAFTGSFAFTGATVINAGTLGINRYADGTIGTVAYTAGSINVNAGGTLKFNAGTTAFAAAGTSVIPTGRITLAGTTAAPTSRLDVTNNGVIFQNATRSDIESLVKAGYASGAQTGQGIISSTAATFGYTAVGVVDSTDIGSPATFGGQNTGGAAVLVRYTLSGDADLSGTVDSTDFGRLVAGYGTTTASASPSRWFTGDFNYDGSVDTVDFAKLISGFGRTLPASGALPEFGAPGALVPEPASIGLLLGGLTLARRRRR